MAGTASEIDAGFFQMIHQLVNNREETDEERREDRRLSFDTMQRIAPWDGARFPADSEFFQVRCHDLTCNGLSFFLPAEPDFRSLVVQFGTQPNSLLAAAEIQRTSRVLVSPSGQVETLTGLAAERARAAGPSGGSKVLVGCRLTRRLYPSDTSS